MGDRFATFFERSLNFLRASYLDCRMSHYYVNITRNTFTAKTSRGCNGPAVRIKENKPRGKCYEKQKQKQTEKNYTTKIK